MKAKDWLDLMPIVAHRGWHVSEKGYIRDAQGFCPLCALANEVSDGEEECRAWPFLPIRNTFGHETVYESWQAYSDVVESADLPTHTLRLALMASLDMTDTQPSPLDAGNQISKESK